jgi:hypothetical protein
VLILIAVILLVFITNLEAEPPQELKQFIKNTNDEYYWTISVTPNSIYLMIHYQDYYKFYSVGLFEGDIVNYKDLKENIYDVSVNDSRIENSVISWMRFGNKNNPLTGPKRYDTIPYTAYNIKDYYNPITNKLAFSMKRISNYKKMEEPFIEDWVNYSARYNLEGAKGGLPIEMEAYQGKLIITLNESFTKMNEIYISSREWVFIRHVEKGKYPGNIDVQDLDSILENIWWARENIILPLENQFEELKG